MCSFCGRPPSPECHVVDNYHSHVTDDQHKEMLDVKVLCGSDNIPAAPSLRCISEYSVNEYSIFSVTCARATVVDINVQLSTTAGKGERTQTTTLCQLSTFPSPLPLPIITAHLPNIMVLLSLCTLPRCAAYSMKVFHAVH